MTYSPVWTRDRVAQLGYLVGLGRTTEQIAEELHTTVRNIYRQSIRFSMGLREHGGIREPAFILPAETLRYFTSCARRRGVTRNELIRRILTTIALEPNLLDNVLDE